MTDIFRVDGRTAVIIGGTGQIGEAIGRGLAEYGAEIAVAGHDAGRAEQVASELRSRFKGSAAKAFSFDITDEKSVKSLRDQVVADFGSVDILVNAHGVNVKQGATDFPVKDWDFLFNVNVRGTMLVCREFGKVMIEKKRGKVINLSSVRGIRATAWGGNEGYAATKGAIDMITRSLASEWAPYRVNVNAIAPSKDRRRVHPDCGAPHLVSDPAGLPEPAADRPFHRRPRPDRPI